MTQEEYIRKLYQELQIYNQTINDWNQNLNKQTNKS